MIPNVWRLYAQNLLLYLYSSGRSPVDFSFRYLSAAKTGEEILINADTLKVGKTLAFLTVDITNKDSGKLIARGSHTKYVG